MMLRILPFLMFPFLGIGQSNSKVEIPMGENTTSEMQPLEIKRNATYNLEEIKVRWKKAALENCTGVPCIVAPSFTCLTSTVSDIDNNVYNTVTIGTQCWIKENLKVTKYNDNTAIPLNAAGGPSGTSGTWAVTTGAYTIYGNESSTGANATNFGFLYNWYAATDSRKICPTGYHVPTDSDWNKLIIFIHSGADTSSTSAINSTSAGTVMKSTSTLWNVATPPSPGTNTSDFSALPGGYRNDFNGSFLSIRDIAFFWSATESPIANSAYYRNLFNSNGNVNRNFGHTKSAGASIRCLRD